MNESSQPNQEQREQTQTGHDEATNTESKSTRAPFESFRSALHDGAQQAKRPAEEAAPKVKAAIADATYWLGFGTTFATVLLAPS